MIKFTEKGMFSLFLFIFSVSIIVSSFGMRSDVVFLPKIIAYLLLIFSGIQVIIDLFPGIKDKFAATFKNNATNGSNNFESIEMDGSVGQRYLFVAWMVVFVLLIMLTNMIIASFVSFFIYLKWVSKTSMKFSIGFSAIFAISIYLIFVVGMGISYLV